MAALFDAEAGVVGGATASLHASAAPAGNPCLPSTGRRVLVVIVLLAILAGNLALRWRLVDIPLERDEGEYAYAGQLLLRGHPPYERAFNMKMPGIYLAYAGILAVFGETHQGIHQGLLILSTLTVLAVFFLGRRLFGDTIGLFAAAAFALHSLMHSVLGFTANAEHFVLLPALAAVLALLWAIDSGRWMVLVLSGLLFGSAFLMKQHGMFFGFFAGFYLLWHELSQRPIAWPRLIGRSLLLTLAALVPFGLTCLWLWQAGVFDTFWFWAVDYATTYVTAVSPIEGIGWLPESWLVVAEPCFILWGLAFLGLDAACRWDPETRPRRRFLGLFMVFSFLAVCPGFWFREHYFILMLPAMALAAGVGAVALARKLNRTPLSHAVCALLLAGFGLGTPLWTERDYLFKWSPAHIAGYCYSGNPTVEALALAEYVKTNTEADDTLAILGSEPQVYFYANRYSATGHIYVYALMEEQPYALQMQREMIAQIEAAQPEFVLYVHIESSWTPWPGSVFNVQQWWEGYQANYERVGVVALGVGKLSQYWWGDDARRLVLSKGEDACWVAVYKRRS